MTSAVSSHQGPGRVQDKVVCITGAARSQGRSHAVRLAQEGAHVIAVDVCGDIESVAGAYPGSTREELDDTVAMVQKLGRNAFAVQADVRDRPAMESGMRAAAAELGGLDVVVANAGIFTRSPAASMSTVMWREMIDINLTGAWNTAQIGADLLVKTGRGGSIVLISSGAGLKGAANAIHYSAAKHALVGMARSLAQELGEYWIRVNTIHPTNVETVMIQNPSTWRLFRPDLENPGPDAAREALASMNLLPLGTIDPIDVSNALLWLVSDEARYLTGIALPVDAGLAIK